jgi:hypothetical protein
MPTTEDDLKALERFVAENDELLELEGRIGRFNVFDALKIARTEIRHSNFLAWLLRPNESHGLGDVLLKALLMDIMRKAREQGVPVPVGAIDLDGAELHGTEVKREWRNIDLLIDSESPAFVVAIENKVDSGEHSNQLDRYERVVREQFAGKPHLFVYLTPDGEEASDADWVNYSYANLHSVLSRAQARAAGSLGGDVAVFLDHYLNLIGSKFMNDPDIERLCRQIYSNHARAIELIIERVDVGGSGIASTAARWLKERPKKWHVAYAQARYVKFYPLAWLGSLCDEEGNPRPKGVDLFFELQVGRSALHLRCVVGKGEDLDRRKRVIQRLINDRKEFGFRMQRKEPTDRWTRISAERIVEVNEEDPPSDEAIAAALESKLGSFEKSLDQIAAVVLDTK